MSAVKARRTYHSLENTSPISDERIKEIAEETILRTPSAFNSQSTRVVVLFGAEHQKLWDITKEAVKAVAPAEQWPTSKKRLDGFKGGYGTVSRFIPPRKHEARL